MVQLGAALAAAFVLAFGVYALLSRRWGVGLAVAALMIGCARVSVGVHYPGDIAASAVIGGLAVLEVVTAARFAAARSQGRYVDV